MSISEDYQFVIPVGSDVIITKRLGPFRYHTELSEEFINWSWENICYIPILEMNPPCTEWVVNLRSRDDLVMVSLRYG